jgi:hypothetical protein
MSGQAATAVSTATPATPAPTVTTISSQGSPASTATPPSPTAAPRLIAPSPTASSAPWQPAPIPAIGTLAGEGQWTAYQTLPSGQVVAYRTFLQPDPQRPYAVVGVVAFDLSATRLHFVLGSQEPFVTTPLNLPGRIPASDVGPSLLATFNGGFKGQHGQFGAMAGGVTALPPRAGLGAVALYADGSVRIGVWGTDITATPALIAWRQNGPLLIHNGVINPHSADNAPQDWGATVNGDTVTWRSGLGLSADGHTLYYVAGPSLNVPALANALAATGAAQAMQLDINNFWVHFDAIQSVGGKLRAAPLLDTMSQSVGRYLQAYPRDFFYVTANGN